ncbi:hypothetical protein T484DRAFT_3647645, partial [Baffinella frigidus]
MGRCGNESLVPLYNDITSRLRGIRDTVTWDATQVAFMSRVLASYQGCGVNNLKPQLCVGNFVPQMFGVTWKSLTTEIEGFKKAPNDPKFVAFLTKLNRFVKDSDTEEQKLLGERKDSIAKVKMLEEAATARAQRYAESAAVKVVQDQLKTEHAELVKTRKELNVMQTSNTDVDRLRTQVASLTEKSADTKKTEASRYESLQRAQNNSMKSLVQEKIELTGKLEKEKLASAGKLEEANKLIEQQDVELKKSATKSRQLNDMTQEFHDLDDRTQRELQIAQTEVDRLRAEVKKLNTDKNEYIQERNASESAKSEERMSRDNSRNKMQDLKKEHLAAIDVLKKEHLAAIDVLKKEHLAAIDVLKEAHRIESNRTIESNRIIEADEATHAQEIDELKAAHEKEINELKVAHEQEIADLKEAYDEEMTTAIKELEDGNTEVIAKLRQSHKEKMGQSSVAIQWVRTQNKKAVEKIKALQKQVNDHMETITELRAEIVAVQESSNRL